MSAPRVGVVGLGAIGSMTLWQLARRGIPAVGFEQHWSPNDRSAHAGESRLFRSLPYLEKAPGDRAILRAARGLWQQLEQESGHHVYFQNGGLVIGREDNPGLRNVAALAAGRDGTEANILDAHALRGRFPQFRISDGEMAVLDVHGGLLKPEWAVAAAVRTAVAHGAQVRTASRVRGWREANGQILVETGQESVAVDKLIVCPGPYAGELLPDLPLKARRLLLAWFAPDDASRVPAFQAEAFPSFVRESELGFTYGGPSFDNTFIKLGGDFDWGRAEEPSCMDRNITAEDLAGVRAVAAQELVGIDSSPVRAEMYMDAWSDDGTALLGALDADATQILAAGFTGYGFKISPVIGSILADLAGRGETDFDIGYMSPARFRREPAAEELLPERA
ncbi:FAD-dependent oxidoreductase [Arthrobacter mobilis]|uniref:FAD-dependent oxidoreductase n=1 Tax=Arthrobacter mobilis TaxID=2724944 RepID=A0A7X6HE03_9MICC|nr:FAD-dependent oxidoreductase [Arthrobacter mobilis]NKX54246.1 FAD-dependent oxidoreductase [Arthrobacter mobilis]